MKTMFIFLFTKYMVNNTIGLYGKDNDVYGFDLVKRTFCWKRGETISGISK